MASQSITGRWMSVLLEASENVRSRVRGTLISKAALDTDELKTALDAEAQQAIRETLTEAGIPVRVISEEGDYDIGEGGPLLVVDPLDGTTNTARGIPFACTSMALSETPYLSGVLIGLVRDIYTGDVYRAVRDKGAHRSGKRITPAKSRLVSEALVSMDISKGSPVNRVRRLISSAGHLRQTGSSALSLCHLASGLIDVHVDVRGKLRITDAAAGLLILREAGGEYRIEGTTEDELRLARDITLKLVAASSQWTLQEVLKTLD